LSYIERAGEGSVVFPSPEVGDYLLGTSTDLDIGLLGSPTEHLEGGRGVQAVHHHQHALSQVNRFTPLCNFMHFGREAILTHLFLWGDVEPG